MGERTQRLCGSRPPQRVRRFAAWAPTMAVVLLVKNRLPRSRNISREARDDYANSTPCSRRQKRAGRRVLDYPLHELNVCFETRLLPQFARCRLAWNLAILDASRNNVPVAATGWRSVKQEDTAVLFAHHKDSDFGTGAHRATLRCAQASLLNTGAAERKRSSLDLSGYT